MKLIRLCMIGGFLLLLLLSCTSLEKRTLHEPRDSVAQEYYAGALRELEKNNISRALMMLSAAQSRSPRDSGIRSMLNQILSKLEPEIIYRHEVIKKGRGLASPLQYILRYRAEGGKIPVSDIPVYFLFREGSGLLTGEALTDDLGIAKCYVEEIRDFSSLLIVEARVILDFPGGRMEPDSLVRTYVFRDVSVLDLSHLILLHLEGAHFSFQSDPCTDCVRPFHQNGFSDVRCALSDSSSIFEDAFKMEQSALKILKNQHRANILVLLKLTPQFMEQQSADFYLYRALAQIKIIDTDTFSLQFEDSSTEKGAGRTAQEAEEHSFTRSIEDLSLKVEQYLKLIRRRNGI
jgi:hypothetical protein